MAAINLSVEVSELLIANKSSIGEIVTGGMTWKRPEGATVPTVWATVEGKRPLQNGKIPRFRIQDLPPELDDEAVEHMKRYFLQDEPLCSHLDITSDEASTTEMGEIWKKVTQYRLVLVALVDNPEDFTDLTLPVVAGCNMTLPIFPEDEEPKLKSSKIRSILNYVTLASHQVDSFKKYDVSIILYALGLSVAPEFRGQGLGEEILKARYPLCKAVGIPLTTTVFTGPTSQAIARKVGFELLSEITPDKYLEDGNAVFLTSKSKSLQTMAKKF